MNLENLNVQALTEREAMETTGGNLTSWIVTPDMMWAIIDAWIETLPEAPR
ncbi:hypothetical protein [Parapedobacter tibetensis]|uniref:hypothetical protein n=1 Tax=Parapedobacter tibetensis TaxID=2972951 RepID=UPI00214D545C|nr:hypothetical protein [Parapedobacter tibetensis]